MFANPNRFITWWLAVAMLKCTYAFANDAIVELKPARDLNLGGRKAACTISVTNKRVAVESDLVVDIKISNYGEGFLAYNAYFHSLTYPPGRLAIFDSRGKYLGDLLKRGRGSFRHPELGDWAYVPDDGYLGRKVRFVAGEVPGMDFNIKGIRLPPGKYSLQMIFYNQFLESRPRDPRGILIGEDAARFANELNQRELFRSNVVEIEVVNDDTSTTSGWEEKGTQLFS